MNRKPLFKNTKASSNKSSDMISEIKRPYSGLRRNSEFNFILAIIKSIPYSIFYGGFVFIICLFNDVNIKANIFYSLSGWAFGTVTVLITEYWRMGYMLERLGSILIAIMLFYLSTWVALLMRFGVDIWAN